MPVRCRPLLVVVEEVGCNAVSGWGAGTSSASSTARELAVAGTGFSAVVERTTVGGIGGEGGVGFAFAAVDDDEEEEEEEFRFTMLSIINIR